MKSFGKQVPGAPYICRTGAYGVVLEREGRAGVVDTPKGFLLLGGGIEAGESHADCLRRECMEEGGFAISIGPYLGEAESFLYLPGLEKPYWRLSGHFYLLDDLEQVAEPLEPDHRFCWLPAGTYPQVMALPHQAWAIEQGIIFRR